MALVKILIPHTLVNVQKDILGKIVKLHHVLLNHAQIVGNVKFMLTIFIVTVITGSMGPTAPLHHVRSTPANMEAFAV